jgi:hypothetical protein
VIDDTFIMKKKLYKLAAKLNKAIGAQKVNLQVSQLEIDEHKMSAFINEIIFTENKNKTIKKYFKI